MKLTPGRLRGLKVILHLLAFLPLVWLIVAVQQDWLGGDPAKAIQHDTGRMALKLLLATLVVSPLAKYSHQPLLMRCRRLLGLWTFVWATLHAGSYIVFELGLDISLLANELYQRTYLTLGLLCWLILLLLAITSFKRLQSKLGRKWQYLHNFIYLVALLAPLHAILSGKIASPQLILYGLLALILLALRYQKLLSWFKR